MKSRVSAQRHAPSQDLDSEEELKGQRMVKLRTLLAKSTAYSNIMMQRIEDHKNEMLKAKKLAEPSSNSPGKQKSSEKRRRNPSNASDSPRKRVKRDEATEGGEETTQEDDVVYVTQPAALTGATLRPYQLAGVQWLVSLYTNGLNGILADEMGLGKTLQTIAFIAHLRENRVFHPILVVCPLSVVHNWESEFQKFTPSIPTCVYHGTPEERKQLCKLRMPRPKNSKDAVDSDFPIVLTTYEMVIKDRNVLNKYYWSFVIVDEGHRLKNMNSKLIREIRTYPSANRLILTGTPLHNNLDELWSLLNFVLPDIFDDLSAFQEWFSAATSQTSAPEESGSSSPTPGLSQHESNKLISTLHGILRPFLLRRLKVDVEKNLPPKKEYVLYAPLTKDQIQIYERVLEGGHRLREWIVSKMLGITEDDLDDGTRKALRDKSDNLSETDEDAEMDKSIPVQSKRKRKGACVDYKDQSDEEFFMELDNSRPEFNARRSKKSGTKSHAEKGPEEVGRDYAIRQAFKIVNNMQLQNKIMQLRKVCSHPYLFHWPTAPGTSSPEMSSAVSSVSGKMLLLNRLLDALFARKHKVLIFSQFTRMLDIIEDWATEVKGWDSCRIDGTTSPQDRREQMNRFNSGGEGKGACRLFLLSTRAGGLGINLVTADTVIFYDQDWNPQMDLQAQDRAHRIGQTRPVLVFRLVAAHTIETHIMERASQKRKLEALVIAKGKFKQVGRASKNDSSIDVVSSLLTLEAEKVDVLHSSNDKILSDADLEVLLDRSPEVFSGRGDGWSQRKAGDTTKKVGGHRAPNAVAFQVFNRTADEANDGLASMLDADD